MMLSLFSHHYKRLQVSASVFQTISNQWQSLPLSLQLTQLLNLLCIPRTVFLSPTAKMELMSSSALRQLNTERLKLVVLLSKLKKCNGLTKFVDPILTTRFQVFKEAGLRTNWARRYTQRWLLLILRTKTSSETIRKLTSSPNLHKETRRSRIAYQVLREPVLLQDITNHNQALRQDVKAHLMAVPQPKDEIIKW